MTIEEMEKKIIEYYEQEYYWACDAIDRNVATPREIIHNAKQRLLGVNYFAKTLGVDYNTLEILWYDYTEKLDDLD